jgi:signal transduction histidine kinase
MIQRRSLFVKYAIYFASLVTLALIASGGIGVYVTYQESKTALLDLQREKAAAAASRIEAYVQEIEHQIGWMRLPQAGATNAEQRRFDYLKLLRQVPAVTDIAQLDRSGRERLSVSRLGMDAATGGEDFSKDPKFTETKGGKTYFSPVYFRKETEPYMTVSMAGISEETGIIVAEVNLKFIWDVISRIKTGKNGFAYVIDNRGRLIAHPDISQVLQKSDLSSLPQVKAALGGAGGDAERVSIARDPHGREALAAYASIPSLGWHVFVEQPLEEAFAPLYASLKRTGVLLLGGLVLAVLASLFLARRMLQPINALRHGAEEIGAGRLEQKIEVHTGDEIEALAGQFNNMAAKLKESYFGLEKKVDARTHELTEALEQQTATSSILRAISSSAMDLNPVFQTILENAIRLCGAQIGMLGLYDGEKYLTVAQLGGSSEFEKWVMSRGPFSPPPQYGIGRMIETKAAVQLADYHASPAYRDRNPNAVTIWELSGARTFLAVPLLKGKTVIGGISILRTEVREFTQKQIDLVTTFANQAVIAIENVRLFNEIREKGQQLEVANRHKSEFLANMSHELRTPLNAVIGFSEVLQERMFGELNDKQAEYINDIHGSGQHLLSLINDILDLSKVEAGRMELDLSAFDLPSAIDNALTLIRERAGQHNITLECKLDPALGTFNADERKFKQILLNLLSNAVKFTPEGGRITVAARAIEQAVEISVTDTGIGIAKEDCEAVFEEFRQVGADYTHKAEGTGLGLALTRKFVELHGGGIGVKSEPGKGSVFTFTLPLEPTPTPAASGQ